MYRVGLIFLLLLATPAVLTAAPSNAFSDGEIEKDLSINFLPEYVQSLKTFFDKAENGENAVQAYLQENNISATRIHKALLKQNNYDLKYLLYSLHSPDTGDSHGLTPLHYAALANNVEAVKLLLEFGAASNPVNTDELSPYDMAVLAGSQPIVALLEEWGVECSPNKNLLLYAARSGNKELISYLYKNGVRSAVCPLNVLPEINICALLLEKGVVSNEDKSPLYYAVIHKSAAHISLFAKYGQFMKSRNASPLAAAAACNDIDSVKLLINNHADVNARLNGKTSLYYAALNKNSEMLLFLLNNGADPESDDSPLSAALLSGSKSAFELLREHGAKAVYSKKTNLLCDAAKGGNADLFAGMMNAGYSIYDRDAKGNTPFHYAAVSGSNEILKYILSKKYPPAAVNRDGDTALHLASFYGKSETVRFLLNNQQGKKITKLKNRSGETPLLSSISGAADPKTIQLLINYGANRSDVNYRRQNIFHIAVMKNPSVIPFLFKYSRELNVKDSAGETPLIYAIKYDKSKNFETVALLIKYGERIGFISREGLHEWELAVNYPALMKDSRYFPLSLVVKLGAPVNSRDREGRSLLINSIINNRYADIDFLLQHKADVDLADKKYLSAMSYAMMSDDEIILNKVLEAKFGRRIEKNDELNWIMRETGINSVHDDMLFPSFRENKTNFPAAALSSAKSSAYFYMLERNSFSEWLISQKMKRSYTLSLIRSISIKGFNIDNKFSDGTTLLMKFSAAGDFAAVKNIISMNTDINARDKNGWTALMYSLLYGNSKTSKLLVDSGADINTPSKDGINAMLAGYASGDRKMIDYLESKGGSTGNCSVNVETVRFMTALERTNSVKSIYKVDMKYRDNLGRTPLLKAAEKGSLDTVRFLIDAGADINAKSVTGDTFLLYAIYSGNRGIVNQAVKSAADPNEKNKAGINPLIAAVTGNMYDIIPQLVNCGADPNYRDANGQSILFRIIAVKNYPTSIIGYLVEKGILVDQKDNSARTPLMISSMNGNYRSSYILLSAGSDLFLKDRYGKKAIDYAIEARSTELIKLFMEHGEKPTAQAYSILGDESLEQNRYSDAARYYRKAIAADLKINVYNNLGRAHLKMRDYSIAEKCFMAAIKMKPEDPVSYFNMACYFSQLNRKSEAIDWLTLAINKGYSNYNNLYTENSLVKIRNTDAFNRLVIKNQKN